MIRPLLVALVPAMMFLVGIVAWLLGKPLPAYAIGAGTLLGGVAMIATAYSGHRRAFVLGLFAFIACGALTAVTVTRDEAAPNDDLFEGFGPKRD